MAMQAAMQAQAVAVYQRIFNPQAAPDRDAPPVEPPVPGQPRQFLAVLDAMRSAMRRPGMVGVGGMGTSTAYPLPAIPSGDVRIIRWCTYLCPVCYAHGLSFDARRCRPHLQEVTRFRVSIPIYTDEGRHAREAAGELQQGAWVSGPQWQQGWSPLTLRSGATRYRDLAGQIFWVNTRDLAWFEELVPGNAQQQGGVEQLAQQVNAPLINGH